MLGRDREKRLSQYITTDSKTGMIACIFCQKVPQAKCPSTRLHHLMEHIESVHLKIMRYKCKFCDKKYPRNFQLSTHLKLKHNVDSKNDPLNVPFSGNLVEKTHEDFDGVTDPVKIELSKLGRTKSRQDQHKRLFQYITTGKSLSEALIFASINPQYDDRLFIELQVQYMKIPSSNLGRTCCVQQLFLTFRTIFVQNMFSPCSAKRRASDKDLPVQIATGVSNVCLIEIVCNEKCMFNIASTL